MKEFFDKIKPILLLMSAVLGAVLAIMKLADTIRNFRRRS